MEEVLVAESFERTEISVSVETSLDTTSNDLDKLE